MKGGFTLLSSVIAIGIFAMLSMAVFSASAAITKSARMYREKTTLAALADKYMEIARNLPYGQVGTTNGNPSGSLPDEPNALSITYNNAQYQIYYEVTYVDDPADGTIASSTDYAANDYKQVKLDIRNVRTGVVTPFITNAVPKGLESLANGGALSIKVFDAVGQPVPNATIQITNTLLVPSINLTRTSDANGNWIEVGLPDSNNSYHVTVKKNGYSSDQTLPVTVGNPNPTKPNATIANGQITQISFSIDALSSLVVNTVNETCAPLSGIGVELRGAKLIGTPSVYKSDYIYTSDVNGRVSSSSIEWDNYTPIITSAGSMIYGSSPIQQISILPNTTQQSTLILGPTTANSLLVIVKDAATGNPIENATVELERPSAGYDSIKYTQGSIWNQQDWSGGAGQTGFSDATEYFSDDGNLNVTGVPTGVRLLQFAGTYAGSGSLVSSTFDTGTASTSYTTFSWSPASQSASTTLKFQIATNNDDATWNYLGPDGTSATYFTTPGSTIHATSTGNRYVRYKAFLSTIDSTVSPVLSSMSLNYVSGCAAPGQTMFAGVTAASDYTLTVSMAGYQTQTISNATIGGYNTLQVLLSH